MVSFSGIRSPARAVPAGGKQLDRIRVARHELRQRLLGGLQAHEFRFGAAQRDRTRFRIGRAGRVIASASGLRLSSVPI